MSVGLYSGVSGLALGTGLYKNVSGLWSGASGLTAGFGGGSPFGGASLYLDFLAGAPLDSRITFSRGSNATLVDSTGKITYAPNNLLTYSGFEGTVVGTPGTAPNDWPFNSAGGSITSFASGVIGVSATAGRQIFGPTLTIPAGQTQVWSITIVSNPNSLPFFQLFVPVNITGFASIVYYANGVAVNQTAYIPNANDRLAVVLVNGVATSTPTFRIGIGASGVSTGTASFTQPQAEVATYQTTPGTYNATTSAAYYGPRFDYDPVTLAPKGLLIEEARTNIVLYSQQFDDAAWTKSGATVTANATTSPDGTSNADKLAETSANAPHYAIQTVTVAAVAHTASVYVKAAERTWCILEMGGTPFGCGAWFNLSTGVVGTQFGSPTSVSITAAGNGWWRITMTKTAASAGSAFTTLYTATGDNVSTYAGTTGSGIFLYGAQLEAGAFATSYIPTVASTVTRSADVATMTGTNFSSWYNQSEGTFVVDTNLPNVLFNTNASLYTPNAGGSNSNRLGTNFSPTDTLFNVLSGGASQAAISTGVASANTPFKIANSYKQDDFASCKSGATVATDTSGLVPVGADQMCIGTNAQKIGAFLNGHIRQIAYYNTRLSNTQLQTLTAPSLATTLSLSFTNQAYTVGV